MKFSLVFTEEADSQLTALEADPALLKQSKAVKKALGYMELNIRHPGLATHKYDALGDRYGCEVFEAYAQNQTPGAWRIFWHYGPAKGEITIIAITPHP